MLALLSYLCLIKSELHTVLSHVKLRYEVQKLYRSTTQLCPLKQICRNPPGRRFFTSCCILQIIFALMFPQNYVICSAVQKPITELTVLLSEGDETASSRSQRSVHTTNLICCSTEGHDCSIRLRGNNIHTHRGYLIKLKCHYWSPVSPPLIVSATSPPPVVRELKRLNSQSKHCILSLKILSFLQFVVMS